MLNSKHQTSNPKQISISNFVLRICLVFLISNFFFTSTTHASDISLVVSPPRTDIQLKPGETVQKTVKVTNTNDQELILSAQVVDFIVSDDLGTPIKVDQEASGRFLASPWFSLTQDELVIPPKETAQITALITAPKDALPGGHYAGIYFTTLNARGEKKTISYTTSQVGSLFALNIEGDINYDALIKDFSTPSLVSEYGPIDFSLTTENQSDTHITPVTQIAIKNMLGQTLDTLTPDSLNIFPFTSRTQSARWDQIWGFGKYVATATITYGPGATTSRDLIFWIIPYRLIAAILVVLMVIIAGGISLKHHLRAQKDTRDQEIDELKRKIAELENNNR